MKEQCYGLLKYSSINIGDEIQSIAASRFLPQIDKYVHRERTNKYKSEQKTKLIMNAWWMHNYKNFPPSEEIDPLLISMYINKKRRRKFLTPKVREFLSKHGPVGCRDKSTCEWLNANNIPAYFSGCLTLTLQRNPKIKKKDFILTVDVPDYIIEIIKQKTKRPVFDLSRLLLPNRQKDRFEMARVMLYMYQSAHCVVSSRLHSCMPSLALETPVLMIDSNDGFIRNDGRFEGLKELCNVISENEILEKSDFYDFENPPKNPDTYLKIRENLIKKCSEFTGYNKEESLINFIDEDHIISTLINYNRYDYSYNIQYLQWWVKKGDLLKTLLKKFLSIKDKHDLD